MGAGNWIPSLYRNKDRELPAYEMVYVENESIYGDEVDPDLRPFLFQDFLDTLARILPGSFERAEYWVSDDGWISGMHVFAENGLFYLVMQEHDDYVALALIPKHVNQNLAESKLDLTAKKMFDKLADHYELSVRTSAWTTAKYQRM